MASFPIDRFQQSRNIVRSTKSTCCRTDMGLSLMDEHASMIPIVAGSRALVRCIRAPKRSREPGTISEQHPSPNARFSPARTIQRRYRHNVVFESEDSRCRVGTCDSVAFAPFCDTANATDGPVHGCAVGSPLAPRKPSRNHNFTLSPEQRTFNHGSIGSWTWSLNSSPHSSHITRPPALLNASRFGLSSSVRRKSRKRIIQ